MNNWEHMEWTDSIDHGMTENGFPFYQVGITGWNGNMANSGKEQLILIRTEKNNLSITTHVHYVHPDARYNLQARKLAKEIKFYLEDSFREDFSTT